MVKLTKQGVRDLNPPKQRNERSRSNPQEHCFHKYSFDSVVCVKCGYVLWR